MKKYIALSFVCFLMMAFVACKKSEDFVNPVYACECGALTWEGESFPLLDASYILAAEDLPLSRKYYLTSDVRAENETETHSINVSFELDSVDHPIFYVPEDTVAVLIEEINLNNELFPYRQYISTVGVINVNGAIFGGQESVSMDLILKELVNGTPVGFDISFKGNFSVNVE